MKTSDHMNVAKDMARQEPSNTSEKNVKWYSDRGEKLSSKSENINNLQPGNSISGYSPQKNTGKCARIFTAAKKPHKTNTGINSNFY